MISRPAGGRPARLSVRTTLALVSAAVTSMVAIAFLIPLAVIVKDVARDQAFTSAQLAGAAVEPVLAVSTDRAILDRAIVSTPAGAAGQLAVYLTGPIPTTAAGATGTGAEGAPAAGTLIGGPQRASTADLQNAAMAARSFIVSVPDGYAVLQPVALSGGRMAVTEVFVPAAAVSRGVAASWAVMTAIALVLVAVSVAVADRLATRVTRPARELALAAALLGDGELTARSTAGGPAELAAAGQAFNVMAERLSRLIAAERAMAADLPHRLRTPLTALRMNASALGPGRGADDTRRAIDRLEREVDLIIRAARRPAPDEPYNCDAAEVITERFGFWSALAEDQARPCQLNGTGEPAPVPLPRSDLAAAADSLIGNIFKHTPEGTGFAVTLHRGEGAVLLLVGDAGRGIADPDAALRRGSSGAGSTGLGLDIARRVAESTGGGLKIGVSALGGAQVQLRLRTLSLPPGGRRGRRPGVGERLGWPWNGGLFHPKPSIKRTLTRPGVAAGVKLSALDVMAMDYGDGAAPNPGGQMGTFAIDAATATDAQVATALGISDAAAWPMIAVTPMIGVNDTSDEVFTLANAQQLAAFAAGKHLAWLSMWSAARDTECPGGAQGYASPTCSGLVQAPDAFMGALGAY